jgi:hypothetical protein
MTEISYHHVRDFPGWVKAPDFLRTLIGDYQPRILLEIGSGANPTLDLEAAQNSGLRYITSDSSEAELAKAPAKFEARLLHLEGDHFPDDLLGRCDMVFSRMVNEHVSQGKKPPEHLKVTRARRHRSSLLFHSLRASLRCKRSAVGWRLGMAIRLYNWVPPPQ